MSQYTTLRLHLAVATAVALLLVAMVLPIVAPAAALGVPTAMAQGAPAEAPLDARAASASGAAIELSRLERSGDLLSLHDRLQPDVRLVVSRLALQAWYASPGAAIPTADPEILDVQFIDWTWGVTGQIFRDVARVTVRQAATVDGVPVEQTEIQHFAFDGARWRWFFGADEAFLSTLELSLPPSAPSSIAEPAYARIDTVWAEIFAGAGVPYTSPDGVVAIADLPTDTSCGYMDSGNYAEVFYCRRSQRIYYLTDFADLMERRFGDYAWPHVMSHEWGHHIQWLLGIDSSVSPELDGGLYDIELELQADCLAGVYAQEAVARGWLTTADLNDAYQISLFSGDAPGTAFDDPAAHGTGDQRQEAFTTGLEDGLTGCNVTIAPAA